MTVRRLLAATPMVVAALMSESYAGPCAQEIDRAQAKIDARLEAKAAAGLSAPESLAATAHHQPTSESIAAAEARLGDIPPERVTAVNAAMDRARDADRVGDLSACEQASGRAFTLWG
jgi:hypothetical protein